MNIDDLYKWFKHWRLSRKGYTANKFRYTSLNDKQNEEGRGYYITCIICLISIFFVSWLPLSLHEMIGLIGVNGGRFFEDANNVQIFNFSPWIYSVLKCFAVILTFTMLAFCLKGMRSNIFESLRNIILITTVICLQILVVLAIKYFYFVSLQDFNIFLVAILPISLGALFLAPLLGLRVTFAVAIYTSIILSLQSNIVDRFSLFVIGIVSSIVVALMVRKQKRRSMIFYTAIVLFLTKLLFFIILINITERSEIIKFKNSDWYLNCVAIFIVCFFSVILANTLLPLFETVFGMITEQKLLELNNLNHPLLKRLQLEAPGTYHHSLMVANIAEDAAAAIGANPLLARVCSYFHDIGKLTHPDYFIENSRDLSLHDSLKPKMSYIIILSHVKDGVELARKYRLNKVIRDAIMQHHGTAIIASFYHKACLQNHILEGHDDIDDQEFRYPGPLVNLKEIAIVSIADACEASVRSLSKPTSQKIRSVVEDIILKRFSDNQLDDAELTFAEISIVREAIIKTLLAVMHGRVQYPQLGKMS